MPTAFKENGEAVSLFSSKAYDAIPKSAFALIAWHLANVISGEADADGAAIREFVREANVLANASVLPETHRKLINKFLK